MDKVTEIFCIADDFCKEYALEAQKGDFLIDDGRKHRNRPCAMSDSEIITILSCFHFGTFKNFKHYYLFHVGAHMRDEFPTQLSYNRFIEIEHRVAIPLMLFIKLICFGECTGITFVDSTKIAVCHNKRIYRNKVFKGVAERGKSTMGWFYGFKLHLVCNDKGELLNFCLTKGNVDDRDERVFGVLSQNIFGKLYADKGYISGKLFDMLFTDGIHLVTGIRSNMKNKLMSMRDKILLRKRSVIETINDELKNICQVEHSRHRSVTNFLMNLLGAIVAYSFFDKKPAIKFEVEEAHGQLCLF
ncbi:MAG: IS982 family transposase [Mediterranea sp.]|nr:IS982 family transposase [Mediterranea sp.]